MPLITDIYWERVNLHLKINQKLNNIVKLKYNKDEYILNTKENEIVINVTNFPEGTMLKKGNWEIYVGSEKLKVSKDILFKLNLNSTFFPYRNGLYAYTVKLDTNVELDFLLKTNFMIENNKPKKFYRLIEKSSLTDKLKIIFTKIFIITLNTLYKITHLFSFNKNKTILFLTENNKKLTGNLKYLYEELINKNYKIKIYAEDISKYTNKLYYLKELMTIASANTLIIDNYVSLLTHLKISSNTKIIQLWHAGVGFKAVGYARFGLEGSPHPYQSSHRRCNYIIVDNEELINIYKELFGVKEESLLPYGMPRINNYLAPDEINKSLKGLYDLNPDFKTKNIILFAPTYRGKNSNQAYYDMNKLDLKKINDFCEKNKSIFVIKMHPFIKQKIEIKEIFKNNIINYSHKDINKLLYITDVLITDYSSCAYEYSFFNRPLIYYRYDKEIYEYLRPPHTINLFTDKKYEVKNFDELINTLEKIDIDINNRFKNINYKKNNSCKKIVEKCIEEKK